MYSEYIIQFYSERKCHLSKVVVRVEDLGLKIS